LNCARLIDSSRKGSTAISVIRCTFALFIYTIGQALVVPNWTFGDEYAAYVARRKLLVPEIW